MNDLEIFLKNVQKYQVPAKERTVFSLGGRGYYENAASDMLAFFLRPDAEHGFGTLFLSAFFECMDLNGTAVPDFVGVTVEREAKTREGNYIDLLILGQDWCLIVENKIWHIPNNPHKDYKDHAKSLRNGKPYLAILSPRGESCWPDCWQRISYAKYCAKLRQRLGEMSFNAPHSKWHLFAREFILHIENELNITVPTMNPNQVAFIEAHTGEIADVQKLLAQYRVFVREEMQKELEKTLPGFELRVREQSWPTHFAVFRCTSPQWNENDMVIFRPEAIGQKFFTRFYLGNTYEPRLLRAKEILASKEMSYVEGRYPYWTSQSGYDSANEAIKELCKLALTVKPVLTMQAGGPKQSDGPPNQV